MTTKKTYPFVRAAEKYARDVVEGKIVACRNVKLACQRHLDDRKRKASPSFPYLFDPGKAERVARFLQKLPHTKGKWAGRKMKVKLEPWQLFSVCIPFGWVHRKTKFRRFRVILIFVARKNGKSIVAGGVGLYMFCADDEFGAEVYSGATTEKQAWEVFRPAKLMVERTHPLREHFDIDVNASNMVRLEDGSRFEPVIGKPGDGASPSCALIDEYHEHHDSSLFDTMETGMGARDQPVLLVITTAGSNIGGPCHELVRDAEKMLEKVPGADQPDLWAMLYSIDKGDDWTDPANMIKANPNYGVSVGADYLQARLRAAMQSPRKQSVFRTKHLNEWVGAKSAWLNMLRWGEAKPRKSLAELENRPCFIGLDLASKIDVVAAVLLFPPVVDDPVWHVHGRYYLPEARVIEADDVNAQRYDEWDKLGLLTLTDGEVIDFEVIKDDLREFQGRFDVQQIGYDPWQATQLAQEMERESMTMVEVGATVRNFSEPMKELEKLVTQRLMAHGGCPVLSWMASNVVAQIDAKENIYPRKERPENKIDGIVALIMALGRALSTMDEAPIDDFLNRPMSM
ncbi:terminase large subunit [Pseudomonas sp. No.21]|uniref:terminase large subunit n=1 Tax=Pseudomonas tohonis TaxID=2725477 RepID=UPI001F426BD3|nr:terminase TerL endonuclease subunit [Pseudomonas tohonis]GJN44898.1 terminase [Pseudomonas tohonis]